MMLDRQDDEAFAWAVYSEIKKLGNFAQSQTLSDIRGGMMNAKEYLNVALGGNMNIGTLTPLAFEEIMEDYARYKLLERSDNVCDYKTGVKNDS